MIKNVSIIGDGAMGSVCAMLLVENGINVKLWGHDADYVRLLADKRENVKFLPGYKLPDEIAFEPDDDQAMKGADLILSAVPCQYMRSVWTRLKPHTPPLIPVVSVTKGIEKGTLLRPSQILSEIIGPDRHYAALSGPTIADEIVRKLPATSTAASTDLELARDIQQAFNSARFRVYTNSDLDGVELAGALKNVIAIAAGVIDGIGAGDNAKAALLARGLAEIKRLGLALGANENTFAGLSGLGDLVTTCVSPKGRNRSFGERIGKGQSAEQALSATDSVVEGAATCVSVLELAGKYDVEMPITQAVYDVIYGGKTVQEGIQDLMTRELKSEGE
ncbi:Glycerol-3-phosphate dehydrogenase [NAD(P)+] [Anaerohalosphaera lusitana]|uniref:Glycerol-3-phosphate dehydrogenase [NAD(P)+] n=1 Tax=Anaerohalosphaera lusitana TaxID=1936003 RepID=A0A1U9NPY7_9BACT|nr:NAD(P)H-dependent glycerol-3-phosphate dehydrogenase [Anaerohalosphaera lusitana]AQT69576.1 Glycerol-3-phosphate dehydrogenase [NAD(P)+] [Anaerohalosphaera lusitana]